MATIANFNIDQGSNFSSVIDVSTTSSGLFQLDSYTARGKIRKSYGSSRYVSFSCSISNNSPKQDTITIALTAAQTKAMKPGRYVYDVEIFTAAGSVIRVLEGQVEVLASATQANPLSEGIEFKYTEENFVAHPMYHPTTADEVNVTTYAEHTTYANQGYVHVYPIGAETTNFSTLRASGSQSATDTVSSSEAESANDTTNNSPADSGGESSSYY